MQIRLVVVLLTGFVVSAPAARSQPAVRWERYYDRQGNLMPGKGQDAVNWDTLYWKGAGWTTNLYVSDKSADPLPELQRAAAFIDSEDVVAMDPAGDFIYEVNGDTIRKISTTDGSYVSYPMTVGSSRGICGVDSSYIYIPDGFDVHKYTTGGVFVNTTLISTSVDRSGFAVCNDTVWASQGDSIYYGYACSRFDGGSVNSDATWNTTIAGVPMNIAYDGKYYYASSGGASPSSFVRFHRDRTVYSTGFAGLDSRGVMCAKIPPPSVVLLAPNGGETWQAGIVHDIVWSSANSTTDSILFRSNCCTNWMFLGKQSPPSGTFPWTVLDSLSSFCQVIVFALGPSGVVSDSSANYFSIFPRLAVNLVTPNGGETWHVGEERDIVWNGAGSIRDSIIYSTDGGASWTRVGLRSGPGPGGTYRWAVPNTPSTNCRVKVFSISPDTLVPMLSSTSAADFRISAMPAHGWSPAPPVPDGARHKSVKDGGALAYGREPSAPDTGYVYAFKGNNTYEFYRYNRVSREWLARESIPARNRLSKKKAVKKGSSLVVADDGKVYATKGNGTLDLWQYDPAGRIWNQRADAPAGAKPCKEGTSAAAVRIGSDDYVYLLKGSGTYEFYRYNTGTDAWDTSLPAAPAGASGRPYKTGSSIAFDGSDTIYCLKGSYNDFAAYSVSGQTWVTRNPLPYVAPPGTKNTKVKDGSQIAGGGGVIYALKGGNTNEFWQYQCGEGKWYTATPMTSGRKRVKGGGGLTYAPDLQVLYAFRGNATWEFWAYNPGTFFAAGERKDEGVQASGPAILALGGLSATPNPFTNATTVSFGVPTAARVSLKLYDTAGALVATLANGYIPAGDHHAFINAARLARGVYLLRLESGDLRTTQKLVVE